MSSKFLLFEAEGSKLIEVLDQVALKGHLFLAPMLDPSLLAAKLFLILFIEYVLLRDHLFGSFDFNDILNSAESLYAMKVVAVFRLPLENDEVRLDQFLLEHKANLRI